MTRQITQTEWDIINNPDMHQVIMTELSGVRVAEVLFTETTGAGTYNGTVTIPAGATILDVIVQAIALWTAATSATMNVGIYLDDAAGFFAGIDLKATDLLAGEALSFAHQGGLGGTYLPTGHLLDPYSATERIVIGTIDTVGLTGNAGRTRMLVVYAVPSETVDAIKS